MLKQNRTKPLGLTFHSESNPPYELQPLNGILPRPDAAVFRVEKYASELLNPEAKKLIDGHSALLIVLRATLFAMMDTSVFTCEKVQ
jgi:hypothetical protein